MAVAEYIRTVASEASHGVAETTHYAAIKALLNAAGDELAPKVRAIIHPGGTGAGLPDGALWTASLLPKPGQGALALFGPKDRIPDRGGVEVKGLDADLEKLADSDQVRKYLSPLKQLLITNLREFAVVQLRDGKATIIEQYRLAESKSAFLGMTEADAKPHERPLKEFLRRALRAQTAIESPGELAFFLASHARDAKARLDSRGEFDELLKLKAALESALGIQFAEGKGDDFFRAQLVETLFYGLFSAWVLWHEDKQKETEAFSYTQTSAYLSVPVIDRLYNAAASKRILEKTGLRHALRNAADVLNRVDRVAFFQAFDSGMAVQYFYEPFLAAFDPELRKQLGVWYTPPEIVQGMVAKCDRLLMDELGEPEGLAGDNVLVLDPCCGTGAFLVEALRVAAERWRDRGEPYADRLRHAATARMFGFELLTGPFVVAHLQVAFLLARHGVRLEGDERAAVFLTNALTGWEPMSQEKRALDPLALYDESDRAHQVKREEQILVVVGNPPYSGYAGISQMDEERSLSDRFRPEKSRGQGLNDLYVRFFAMADRRIQKTGKGLVCFISNYSWLEGHSFAKMRETFLANYDRIWIDNLHGDKFATGKTTPDGDPDPSVFSTDSNREGIQVGTAVATLARVHEVTPDIAQVLYRDFWGTNKRIEFLDDLGHYSQVIPAPTLGFSFRARATTAGYSKWSLLPDLLPYSSPGVKTSRDAALVSIDLEPLKARIEAYFDRTKGNATVRQLIPDLMDSTVRFAAELVRQKLVSQGIRSGEFKRFHYQPFDDRWIYYHPSKLLDERRPGLFNLSKSQNLFILSRSKGERLEEGSPAGLTRQLADWHATRPGSACIPLWLAQSDTSEGDQLSLLEGERETAVRTYNLSPLAWEALDDHSLRDQPETIFFHALAIMHSPAYAEENAGALRQDWPRVPLELPQTAAEPETDATRDWLLRGLALGKRVAALLDIETPVAGIETGDVEPALRSIARFEMLDGSTPRERTEDVTLKARWGYRGQGGVVMPGPDASVKNEDGTRDIVANAKARWTGVPDAVWNYHLGGYQVLKKWLSYREEAILGRPLTLEEIRTFTAICRRIASLLALAPELDAHYHAATLQNVNSC